MTYIPVRPRRQRPDFSLTIINIVFLLLLFYIATGSLIKQNELAADVPITKDYPLERLPRPLLLVTAANDMFLDGERISLSDLETRVRAAVDTSSYLNVLAERHLNGRAFLNVLAAAERTGVPVRLVTIRDEAKGPAGQ